MAADDRKPGKDRRATHDAESDHRLWHRVTETVKPLTARRRAKKLLSPAVAPNPQPPPNTVEKARARHAATSAAAAPAKPALPELSTAAQAGLDKRTAQRLARGQLVIDARLDLHGMTQDEAHGRLSGFIRSSVAAGRRCVLVITGKGFKPTGEVGVLRQAVPRWLNQAEMRRQIVALRHAQPKDGGAGALYVLLKRDREGAAPRDKDAPPAGRLTRRKRAP